MARLKRSKAYNLTFRYLKSYRDLKRSLLSDVEPDEKQGEFLQRMSSNRKETAVIVGILETAMNELEEEQNEKGEGYKAEAARLYFFEGCSYERIAEQTAAGESTPRRWISEMVEKIAVKLFGTEALEKPPWMKNT